jgi:hypothetical protein
VQKGQLRDARKLLDSKERVFRKEVVNKVHVLRRSSCQSDAAIPSELLKPVDLSSVFYFNFAYSAFAAMSMGMSGSASFHNVRKS